MSKPKRPASVREPVQVYLAAPDRALLDKIAAKSGWSRAEVLRRGVRRMAAEVLGDDSPMLAFIRESAASPWPASVPADAAERHDVYLTERQPRAKKRRSR